jgi:energy-coupling factor transporter ATP-binding protein EcfA2
MANAPDIKFSSLRIEGWRQFGRIDVELHPQLTVITGSNGSGKSTLLNIFSGHFGYQRPYLATPLRDASGGYKYITGVVDFFCKFFPITQSTARQVGEITYTNGTRATAQLPGSGGIQYNLSIASQQPVQGFHVPSHRRLPTYQAVGQIPTQPMLPQQAYDHFNGEVSAYFTGGHTGFSSTYRIKEALLSMAVFGPGTKYVQRNDVLLKTFEGFSETLRKILPEEIGFVEISIRSPDVVLVTKSGDFLIDAASGGLMALVDLAWQIYMFSLRLTSFVVTIDEPENHLHPSMQRILMGNLIKTFPQVQFIVATHSPFIVSAVRDARVYVLKHEDRPEASGSANVPAQQTRFVSSIRLDTVNRAGTASQILRDVLGLPTTYPEWVADGVDAIINRYRNRPFNEELLESLRTELKESGYSDLYPDVASALAKS